MARTKHKAPAQTDIGQPNASDLLSLGFVKSKLAAVVDSKGVVTSPARDAWHLQAQFAYVDVNGDPVDVYGDASYLIDLKDTTAPAIPALLQAAIMSGSGLVPE